jgi:hypothetical protein
MGKGLSNSNQIRLEGIPIQEILNQMHGAWLDREIFLTGRSLMENDEIDPVNQMCHTWTRIIKKKSNGEVDINKLEDSTQEIEKFLMPLQHYNFIYNHNLRLTSNDDNTLTIEYKFNFRIDNKRPSHTVQKHTGSRPHMPRTIVFGDFINVN